MTAAKGKGSPFWSITVTCSCPDAAVWACGKDPAKGIPGLLQAGAEQNSNKANEQNLVFDNIKPSVVFGEVCKIATIVCDALSQSTICIGREPHTVRRALVAGKLRSKAEGDSGMRPICCLAPSNLLSRGGIW